jgi:OFA family oxalate/formate antiporter-like MFS transporter
MSGPYGRVPGSPALFVSLGDSSHGFLHHGAELGLEYGWTASMVSLIYSIGMISAGVASLTAGRLADHLSPRLVFLAGSTSYGLGLLLASQTASLLHLYLFCGVMAGIGNSPMNIIATMTVSRWFPKAQGLAMGILNSGTGAGPAIFGRLAGYLIVTYGWKDSYIILDPRAHCAQRLCATTQRSTGHWGPAIRGRG